MSKISHTPDPSPHIQGLLQLCPEVIIGLRGRPDKLSGSETIAIEWFWESRNLVSVPWLCPEPSPFTITRSTSEIFQCEQNYSLPQNGKSGLQQNISFRLQWLKTNKPLAMKSFFWRAIEKNPLWSIFWFSIRKKNHDSFVRIVDIHKSIHSHKVWPKNSFLENSRKIHPSSFRW